MTAIGTPPTPEQLADESAIRAVLATYCRGVDRADAACLRPCFWDDAAVDYGGYQGAAQPFCALLPDAIAAWGQTHHQIGQTLIDWRGGDMAAVETYVTAFHFPADGAGREMTYVGRYWDRFERRDGVWKIANRVVVMSWTQNPLASHGEAAAAVAGLTLAARVPEDVVYR